MKKALCSCLGVLSPWYGFIGFGANPGFDKTQLYQMLGKQGVAVLPFSSTLPPPFLFLLGSRASLTPDLEFIIFTFICLSRFVRGGFPPHCTPCACVCVRVRVCVRVPAGAEEQRWAGFILGCPSLLCPRMHSQISLDISGSAKGMSKWLQSSLTPPGIGAGMDVSSMAPFLGRSALMASLHSTRSPKTFSVLSVFGKRVGPIHNS